MNQHRALFCIALAASVPAASAGTDECPRFESIDDGLEPSITLLRCPGTDFRYADTKGPALSSARASVRAYLDNGIEEDARQLPRAAYIHLCGLQMKEEGRLYPAMAITCTWHADVLDRNALANELGAFSPQARANILKQAAQDIAMVREKTLAGFPKTTAAREWQLFYDLPMRLREEARARRKTNAKAIQALVAFDKAIQSASYDHCEAPLKTALTSYMRGATTLPSAKQRMTDPIGYALAEALARCHYYNERDVKAGALVAVLENGRRQVTLAEQIKYAQIDLLAGDAEKAEKFPNLVGSKYSAVKPDDVSLAKPFPNELDDKWRSQIGRLMKFQIREGRVASIQKTGQGAIIRFSKERVPVVETRCHETNRIDRIDRDGKLVYRQECTSTPKGHVWQTPGPVTVDDASGVAPGRYLRVALRDEHAAILSSTASGDDAAHVDRLADIVLDAR